MARYQTPFEIHVHGDVILRPGVMPDDVWEALKPMWQYAGGNTFAVGRVSSYEEEPGMGGDHSAQKLQLCWTVSGDDDFRQIMEDACMGLNDLADKGAAIGHFVGYEDRKGRSWIRFDRRRARRPQGDARGSPAGAGVDACHPVP